MGHGCDLHQQRNVPTNCTYITRSISGKSSYTSNIYKKLLYNFSINSSIINNPDESTLRINYNEPAFLQYMKIHNTGTPYINNKNWCVFERSTACGLYRIGDKQLAIYDENENKWENYIFKTVKQTGTLLEYLSNHYNKSLFPTKDDAIRILNETFNENELNIQVDNQIILSDYKISIYSLQGIIDSSSADMTDNNRRLEQLFTRFKYAMRDNFSIDFSTLMEKFPGIHYNIACRPLCKGSKTSDHEDVNSPRVVNIRNRFPHT